MNNHTFSAVLIPFSVCQNESKNKVGAIKRLQIDLFVNFSCEEKHSKHDRASATTAMQNQMLHQVEVKGAEEFETDKNGIATYTQLSIVNLHPYSKI